MNFDLELFLIRLCQSRLFLTLRDIQLRDNVNLMLHRHLKIGVAAALSSAVIVKKLLLSVEQDVPFSASQWDHVVKTAVQS